MKIIHKKSSTFEQEIDMAFFKTGSSVAPAKQISMKDWNTGRSSSAAATMTEDEKKKKEGK